VAILDDNEPFSLVYPVDSPIQLKPRCDFGTSLPDEIVNSNVSTLAFRGFAWGCQRALPNGNENGTQEAQEDPSIGQKLTPAGDSNTRLFPPP
jgi:hypothetical protein